MARMSIRTSRWPAGVPCWADLTVPDVAAVTGFYRDVLDWDITEPDEEYGGYVIARVDGKAAAGIGPQQQAGPAVWTLYFASDDADKTATTVTEHGGTVLMPPGDVGPLGRMLIGVDPTGAVFGVWQAGTHIGAGVTNQPGGLAWEDLRSSDPDAARTFYGSVFGLDFHPMPEAGPTYAMFSLAGEDRPMGGSGGLADAPAGTPSHWVVYFGVADVDAAVAAATKAGGAVLKAPYDTPYGKMAALADGAGAAFWIVAMDDAGDDAGDDQAPG
jgi:predicted enzyme related to lactoylglutathione lyase